MLFGSPACLDSACACFDSACRSESREETIKGCLGVLTGLEGGPK